MDKKIASKEKVAVIDKPAAKQVDKRKPTHVPSPIDVYDSIINTSKEKKMYGIYVRPDVMEEFDRILKQLGYKRNRSEVVSQFIENFNNYYRYQKSK